MNKTRLTGFVAAAALLSALAVPGIASAQLAAPGIDETTYPTDHGPMPMTVYRPAAERPGNHYPAAIFVHGGAWVQGSRQLLDSEARAAAQRGLVVFDIDYDLSAPRAPREYRDVEAAIGYVRAAADRFGVDRDRIGGLGTSAGANLLMQAVITDHAPLAAVVGWSGPYDLTAHTSPKDVTMATGSAAAYLGCVAVLPNCRDRAAAASPVLHVSPGAPPALLFNSSDELVAATQITELADRLRAAGATVSTQLVPGHRHAVAYSDVALGPTLDFLTERLSVTSDRPSAGDR
ncbi:alpha/beta hydrolase [Nocardia sp. GAS34]|uniref:alpha/beta hydrolase n=1 Tax=Nocardia sp. GAS34 TaxID=3156305 RepID=UPI003D1A200A